MELQTFKKICKVKTVLLYFVKHPCCGGSVSPSVMKPNICDPHEIEQCHN